MSRNYLTRIALENVASRVLNEEVEYFMSIDREEPGYDLYNALNDAYDLALDNRDRRVVTASRKVLIEIGCWRHVTDEELARTETTAGKKYDFSLGGKKYVWEKHLK